MIQRIWHNKRAASEGGFTLIELLVVIVILGILAAVVVFSVSGLGDRGQAAACTIDERTLRTAAEAHFAQEGDYSITPSQWTGAPVDPLTGGGAPSAVGDTLETNLVNGGFLSELSEYHNMAVYDNNSNATDVTPAIYIVNTDARCA